MKHEIDDRMFSVERTYIPLALVFTLVSTAAYVATVITNERTRIDGRISEVAALVSQVQTTVDKVSKAVTKRNGERVTKTDIAIWCVKIEHDNPGFKCPKIDLIPGTEEDDLDGR